MIAPVLFDGSGTPTSGPMYHGLTPTERFFTKFTNLGPESCWPWMPSRKRSNSYGTFTVDGKRYTASRFAYEFWVGPIPDGLVVCHKCDNPPCVNPAHLFVGTKADNTRDMVEKGRTAFGTRHPASYPAEVVADIRRSVAGGESQLGVSKRIGCAHITVWRIVHGRRHKDSIGDAP